MNYPDLIDIPGTDQKEWKSPMGHFSDRSNTPKMTWTLDVEHEVARENWALFGQQLHKFILQNIKDGKEIVIRPAGYGTPGTVTFIARE